MRLQRFPALNKKRIGFELRQSSISFSWLVFFFYAKSVDNGCFQAILENRTFKFNLYLLVFALFPAYTMIADRKIFLITARNEDKPTGEEEDTGNEAE